MIYRTSEWVSPGHPDKVADCISEYILDRLLELDPDVRYALEVQIKGAYVNLAGEITTKADVVIGDYIHWAKEAVNKIGYTKEYQQKWGKENTICGDDLIGSCNISQQSSEIAEGVNNDGFGDQGIFTGYAERTNNYMPLDKRLARDIGLSLYELVLDDNDFNGGLDIKTQVTIDEDDKIKQVIVAIPLMNEDDIKSIEDMVLYGLDILFEKEQYEGVNIIVNGTGVYRQHGPIADAGTTGRKLAVDFYGNNAPIGGGSPWTKDGTKADLVLNLYARERAVEGLKTYLEKIGNNGHHAIYQLCCCIGRQEIFGTLKIFDKQGNIIYNVSEELNIKPSELIEKYGLKKPIFFDLCKNGLFEDSYYKWNQGE